MGFLVRLKLRLVHPSEINACTLALCYPFAVEDDLDGVPLDDDVYNSKNQKSKLDRSAAFVPSRWESVDPEEAEAQAMTTSKWELLEQQATSTTTSQDSQDSQQDQDVDDYEGGESNDSK